MNKIFRIKSSNGANNGGLAVRLDQIVSIQYSHDAGGDDTYSVEIMTMHGQNDAILTASELEELQRAWNAAL